MCMCGSTYDNLLMELVLRGGCSHITYVITASVIRPITSTSPCLVVSSGTLCYVS